MSPPDEETKELVMEMYDWDRVGAHEFLGSTCLLVFIFFSQKIKQNFFEFLYLLLIFKTQGAIVPIDVLAKFYPGPFEYTQPLAPRSSKDKKVAGSIRFCVHTVLSMYSLFFC